MKNSTTSSPARHWARLLAGALLSAGLGLAPTAGAQAQTLFNGPATDLTLVDSVLYVNGGLENQGFLLLTGGRLYIDNGDLLNASPGIIRARTANRVVLAGTVASTLTLRGDTLSNLRIDNSGNVTLGSNGAVRGGLRLATGDLNTTTAFSLRVTPTALVQGETDAHFIRGSAIQTRTLNGAAPVDFSGLGFTLNPNGQALTLTMDRRTGLNILNYSYGQNPVFPSFQGIDRIWRLSTAGGNPSAPVNITLSWLPTNDRGLNFNAGLAQVWRSVDNGATWQKEGPEQSGASRTVAIAPTILNAWYTVSTTAAPLPVELTAFTATAQQLDARLAWATASEQNSAYFAIERSINGQDWQEISRQKAAGQSTAPRQYKALDSNAGRLADLLYYRLRQVDTDGSEHYSQVRTVRFTREALGFALEAFPVPLQAVLTLDVRCPGTEPLIVDLLDATGRTILHREWQNPAANDRYQLDVQQLATGSYLLRAWQGKTQVSRKLVKE